MKSLKDIRKIIVDGAIDYLNTFADKNYILIFEDGKNLQYIETEFLKTNYLHLTGIETKLRPNDFFQRCVDNEISVEDIALRKDGSTELKISILPSLKIMMSCNALIGDYESSHRRLFVDIVVGDTKKLMTLGLTLKATGYYVPKTLLREDVKTLSNRTRKVIAVYSKNIADEHYCSRTFICSGFPLTRVEEFLQSTNKYK